MSPDSPDFALKFARDDGTVVVAVSGDVDMATAPLLRSALTEIVVDQGNLSVRVDLASVTFMDSTGLNALMSIGMALRARGGELNLANPSRVTRRLFELTGCTRVVTIQRPEATIWWLPDHDTGTDGEAVPA